MRNVKERASMEFKSVFTDMLKAHIREKRAIGCKYQAEELSFKRFDAFCVSINHLDLNLNLTQGLVESYIQRRVCENEWTRRKRITLTRNLADYMLRNGYPAYVYPICNDRIEHWGYVPYIFSSMELAKIFAEVDNCKSSELSPNRHLIFPVVFRILYGCGLRISEVLGLKVKDVDLDNGTLTVLGAKFNKDRIIPMHPALTLKCSEYAQKIHVAKNTDNYFFPTPKGGMYYSETIYRYFRKVLWSVGISHGGKGKGSRLHDFRHYGKQIIMLRVS